MAPSLRLRPLEAHAGGPAPVVEPRGGWPRWEEDLPPEHEACGSAGFIFCPGAGMWNRQGQLEKVWPWAESQSRPSRSVILTGHPRLCSPTSSFLSLARARLSVTRMLTRSRTLAHTHTRAHTLPRLSGTRRLGQPGLLLASAWVGEGGSGQSALCLACEGTRPPGSLAPTPVRSCLRGRNRTLPPHLSGQILKAKLWNFIRQF